MNEEEYNETLLMYVRTQISANNHHPYADDKLKDFYDGANTALKELAVNFGLVQDCAEI